MKRVFKWTGLGCGGFIVCVLVLAVISSLAGGRTAPQPAPAAGGEPGPAASTAQQPKPTATPKVVPTATALPGIKTPMAQGNWGYQVNSVERQKTVQTMPYLSNTAKGTWLIVSVGLVNTSKETQTINVWDFEVHDDHGVKYKGASESGLYSTSHKLSQLGDQFPPGVAAATALLFDINPDSKGLKLYAVQARRYIDLQEAP